MSNSAKKRFGERSIWRVGFKNIFEYYFLISLHYNSDFFFSFFSHLYLMKRGHAVQTYNLTYIYFWCPILLRFISNYATFLCFACPLKNFRIYEASLKEALPRLGKNSGRGFGRRRTRCPRTSSSPVAVASKSRMPQCHGFISEELFSTFSKTIYLFFSRLLDIETSCRGMGPKQNTAFL